MTLTLAAARRLWQSVPVPVQAGLTGEELHDIEQEFGFRFNPDHRALLAAGLPTGGRWPDWRHGERKALARGVCEPVEGVLFDVEENGFWHAGWGPRPSVVDQAIAAARVQLKAVPLLVPIYGHRYCPALPQFGLPVLSVVQTDVAVFGQDVVDFVLREFSGYAEPPAPVGEVQPVPFWTDLL
jgi:hypothetical protein